MYILYGSDVKSICGPNCRQWWKETYESCCCNLYSYVTLLCISGTEQQKLLPGKQDRLPLATPAGGEGGGGYITRALFVPF